MATVPSGGAETAPMLATANGSTHVDALQGPGPISLTARTSYEHVSSPDGQVVSQVPLMPSGATAALPHARSFTVQFPTQVRPS